VIVPLRFEPYESTTGTPNVIVDGSPNPSTVLTLTHWPGYPAPDGLARDLSAQMAFAYLDRGADLHGDAPVVSNNHFDQDGLVGLFALTSPAEALRRRELLEDVAAAGDFAIYHDRRAARVSMVLAAYASPDTSPLGAWTAENATGYLYTELLGRVVELVDHTDRFRDLWGAEDDQLTTSEQAIEAGTVTIAEHPEVDLAVVTVDDLLPDLSGSRFTHQLFSGVHPMALHNATERSNVLVVRRGSYALTCRYEGWVQFCTRPIPRRVDLRPLAAALTARDSGAAWRATAPGVLTPELVVDGGGASALGPETVVGAVVEHLRSAPPAWDPWAVRIA
jgi:hypothetical protein